MSDPILELDVQNYDGTLTVRAAGEIDLGSSGQLAAVLDGPPDGTRAVVIDLTNVSFLDSSALNTLVQFEKMFTQRGVPFTLVTPAGSRARQILELTHLTDVFRIVDAAPKSTGN